MAHARLPPLPVTPPAANSQDADNVDIGGQPIPASQPAQLSTGWVSVPVVDEEIQTRLDEVGRVNLDWCCPLTRTDHAVRCGQAVRLPLSSFSARPPQGESQERAVQSPAWRA